MRRLFWVAVGATAAVLVARRVSDLRRRYLPGPAAEAIGTATRVLGAARDVPGDLRAAMAEREAELRAALGGEDEGGPSPEPGAARRPHRGTARATRPAAARPVAEDPDEADDLPYSFF